MGMAQKLIDREHPAKDTPLTLTLPFMKYCKCCLCCFCCLSKHVRRDTVEDSEDGDEVDPLRIAFTMQSQTVAIAEETVKSIKAKEPSQLDKYQEAVKKLVQKNANWSYHDLVETLDSVYEDPKSVCKEIDSQQFSNF